MAKKSKINCDAILNEMSLKSDNVEFVRYCGGHFENGDW
jgi:hypothetical protein